MTHSLLHRLSAQCIVTREQPVMLVSFYSSHHIIKGYLPMPDLNIMPLLDMGEIDVGVLKAEIINQLMPEFEWGGRWLQCFPAVTSRLRRALRVWYLQPFLCSVAGASVPRGVLVRMHHSGNPRLQQVRSLYARHYRQLQDSPKLPPINGELKRKGVST